MNYKIVKQRVAFGEKAGKEQYRVVPITTGTKSFQEIVDELVRRTAFSSGDIVGLVTALLGAGDSMHRIISMHSAIYKMCASLIFPPKDSEISTLISGV